MTRLNLLTIWCMTVFSLICYQQVQHNPYGRYFTEALETIHQRALDHVERQPLFDAAVGGMTKLLDQHSNFIPSDRKQSFQKDLDQHFSGIGIEVHYDKEKERVVVANTIVGNLHPAHDAGLRSGDQIVAIDGTPVKGPKLDDALKLIAGLPGTTVRISVLHEGAKEPVDLTVTRQEIDVDSVVGDVREDNGQWRYLLPTKPPIAYVRIKSFGLATSGQLRATLMNLRERGELTALVIDVRDNPGGYLQEAVEVCDLFLKKGVIVTTRGRPEDKESSPEFDARMATGEAPFAGLPMVVLINQESASASEIFAACMQDYGCATIVGSRSYGKGSVQRMFDLEGGRSTLKLTTATYWRPSGKNIHRAKNAKDTDDWGVSPDPSFEVKLSEKDDDQRREKRQQRDSFRPGAAAEPREPFDPQLAKAVEILEAQLAKAKPAAAVKK